MIRINLLPKEVQERGKGVEWVALGVLILILFLFGAMAHYAVKKKNYEKDLRQRDAWFQELQEIKRKVDQVVQLDSQKNILNAKKNTVVLLLQGRLLYAKFMENFFETLPKEVWVTDFVLNEDGSKNIKVEAKSNSLTIEAVADWLQTLESKQDKFSDVSLSVIDQHPGVDGKTQVYGFSMSFTYRPPPLGAS